MVRVATDAEAPPELAERLALTLGAEVEVVQIPDRAELPEASLAGLDQAERLFEQLDLPAARARVAAWLAAADTTPGAAPRERLVEAWLLSALVARVLGDAEASDAALERARVLEPELALDPARYPPSLVARLAELAASAPAVTATLRWGAAPPGLTVSVDGGPWWAAGEVPELVVGRHALRLRAPGRLPRAFVLDVPADGLDLDAGLEVDGLAPLRVGDASAPIDAALRDAAARLGAVPFLLAVEARPRGRLAVRVEDGGSGRVLRWVAPPGASAGAITERALVALSPLEVETREGPPPPRWPIVVGVVVGVLAAAAVVVVVGVSRDDPTGWRLEGTP